MTTKPKTPPQNNLISALSVAAKIHPRTEKILIVPDRTTGKQVLEALTRSGCPWINFRAETVTSLATELVEDTLISKKLKILSPIGALAIIDSVFNALADTKKLKYFEKHPVNKGMVEALTRTIRELRMAGVSSDSFKKGQFIDPAKEGDMRLILSHYEQALEEGNLVDSARLIAMAIEGLKKNKSDTERKYFILSRHYMRGIEREFVEKLCGKDLTVLQEDPAIGLTVPSDAWLTKAAEETFKCSSDIDRLKWLFKNKKAPPPFKDGTIEMFSAVGYRNEVREVLRRIAESGVTVDDAEVVYTDSESYPDLIFLLCGKLGINATFSEGVGAHMTSAGRTLTGFLLWIKEDFGEIYLRHILESDGLKWKDAPAGDMPGGSALGYALRTSGIGWVRERYPIVLEKKIEECKTAAKELRDEGDTETAEYKETKARNLAVLKALCEGLLGLVPVKDADKKIDFGKLCKGCIAFMNDYVKVLGDDDGAFVEAAKERLEMLGSLMRGKMVFDEAMEKVMAAITGIRVRTSGPKYGCLHVSHYRSGRRSGRGNTFIIGLDERKFPPKTAQDPVLLDGERTNLAAGLELSGERLSKSVYDMASLMAGLRGRVTFSYSSYDIKENRNVFPSSIVLQVFRIKEGDPKADYDGMFKSMGDSIGFNESPEAEKVLDETDWWLNKLVDGNVLKCGMEPVQDYYDGIKEGLVARESRLSEELTKYDGKIKPVGDELDLRRSKGDIISPSRLEGAAECPFAYFMETVLGVKKPDETEKDMGAWLDHGQRGLLLHEVFKAFVDKLIAAKNKLDAKEQEKLVKGILEDAIKKYREKVPPPNEPVFENECMQLRRDIEVFLHIHKELGTEPVGAEVGFGGKKEEPVRVSLGDGKSIMLRGSMDRLDRDKALEYHVWDYKTGSTYGYRESGYVAGGEQLQHSLYAVAAEAILRKSGKDKGAKVTCSGYLFPTEKGVSDGVGGIYRRSPDRKDEWQDALNKLLDLIASGTFIVNKKGPCLFCDYLDACGADAAKELMEMKLKNAANKELETWKVLKKLK